MRLPNLATFAEEVVSEALARHILSLPADHAGDSELGADVQIAVTWR